jgi:hypothetical protein
VAGAAFFLAYSLGAPRLGLPRITPPHHFLFYLKAAQSALLGYAVAAAWRWVRTLAEVPLGSSIVRVALGAILAVGLASQALRATEQRGYFQHAAGEAWTAMPNRDAAFSWLDSHARSHDTILANDWLGMTLVGPTGARVLCVDPRFSNPYVTWSDRAARRDALMAALSGSDPGRVRDLLATEPVDYVLRSAADGGPIDAAAFPFLEPVYEGRRISIYRVRR